jgi:2-(1,2-epoxy-1,2-dihydrophenyl)acetyl-CoA isomerase
MTETSDVIRYEYADGLATITWADPAGPNSLSVPVSKALLAAALQARADRARVIVLRAEGRFFSVGGDLAGMNDAADDPQSYLFDLAERAHRVVTELVKSDAIVISAVQGVAAGIGFPMAAAADIVIASEKAAFNLAYVKVGLSPDGGGSLLVHTLGLHRVLRLALLAETMSAQEALDCGLVSRLVPAEELDATVAEIAAMLLAGSPESLAATKRLIRTAAEPAPQEALRRESESISRLGGSANGREGVTAFLAKRAPKFS